MAKKPIEFSFDSDTPEAVEAARKFAARMVTDITDETEANIRNLIAQAIREGIPPADAARMLRPMIGLNTQQGQAAMAFRQELIDNELPLDKVDDQVEEYANKLLRDRADTIARTEILDALNEGQEESFRQARDAGLLSDRATKEVVLTDDACEECVAIAANGPVPLDEDFEEDGPPFHPRCRCTVAVNP